MGYLEDLQKKWNDLLNQKVKEQEGESGVEVPPLPETPKENNGGNNGGNSGKQPSVLDELGSFIDEQYAGAKTQVTELPDAPVYERMETNLDSDSDIEKKAKSSLSEYENLTSSAIEEEIAALSKKYETDKEKILSGYESEESKLGQIYEQAKTNASNDLLKRGLARSSISANVTSGLENELSEKRAAALKDYIGNITAIETEISGLEGKRQKALNDFNISYAAKLTEKINDLKNERDKQANEALKYNNTLSEKEHSAAVDKMMKESDLYTEELIQAQKEREIYSLTPAQKNKVYENIYTKMDEVLGSMTQKEAKALMESSTIFRDELTEYYYYKLLDKYGR